MKTTLYVLAGIVLLVVFLVAAGSFYAVSETEQVILTQFGKPVGEPVTKAGLHFKLPLIQQVNRIEKRVMEWDGPPARMPTKDKVYVVVDNFARWRIVEPRRYYEQLRDYRVAQSRLDDILGSETRNVIARHDFIEAVRTTKDRKAARDDSAIASIPDARIGQMPPISKGRSALEHDIFASAAPKVKDFGIELLDVRFKRINYNESVSQTIYKRMTSERTQIAEHFRSLGAGEAAKILGARDRDLKNIESEAYRKVQEVEGTADARATEIYAQAYNSTPEAVELFEFSRSLDTLKKVIDPSTSLILSMDGSLLRYLKSDSATATATPAPVISILPARTPSPAANAPVTPEPVAPAPAAPANPLNQLPTLLEIK